MAEAEKIIDRGLMIGREEDTLLLDPNPEDTIFQDHIESQTVIHIEVTVDSPDLKSM